MLCKVFKQLLCNVTLLLVTVCMQLSQTLQEAQLGLPQRQRVSAVITPFKVTDFGTN